MTPAELPDAKDLIAAARAAMADAQNIPSAPAAAREKRRETANKVLDQWKPAIDELTDFAGAAAFLGLKGPDSLKRLKYSPRVDGTPGWPEPDQKFGRTPAWKYRTIVLHRAESPGRGHPGATLGRTNAHKPWDAPRKAED
jgi:hypothetical protein